MMDNINTMATSNENMFSDGGMSNNLLSSVSNSINSNGTGKMYYFNIGSMESFEEKITKAQAESSIHPESWVEIQYVNRTNWTLEFIRYLPTIVMIAMIYFIGSQALRAGGGMFGAGGGRGGSPGGIFSIGKSPAKKIKKEDVNITFVDVAGCDEAKKEIMEFVDFLKDSSRFTKLGAKIPKGALLCGPPGTGKTLLAKAVAGEAGVPFYSISGSDFIEMFVGVGPSRVRDLFKEGRANAPCIIFIDEIDAVGRKRGQGGFRGGGNDERENTLNQLLVEMDGFSPTTGIVVLAGTNRVDILDEALTRPGRFDRQVQVDRPDLKGRKDIFKIHLKGLKLEGPIDDYAGRLAGLTPGFAGADIANICNEAAIVAARRKGESVSVADFEKATDRIIGGLESNKIMSEHERRIVAHHEAGHAMAGWFLEHADPILKVTIIPRTSGALGFAQYLPKEVYLRSQEQIMDVVCMALAGRAAEEVFFGDVTTGASDDLRRVTELVYSTIKDFGMNSSVGQLAFPTNNDTLGDKPYSDSTAEAMDDEARRIVDAMYLRTVALIRKHKTETEKVANLLLEQETMTHDDIVDLVGPRPFKSNSAYQEYVTNRHTYDKPKDDKKEDTETNDAIHDDLTPGLALSLKY
jgi:AFG3 family protein